MRKGRSRIANGSPAAFFKSRQKILREGRFGSIPFDPFSMMDMASQIVQAKAAAKRASADLLNTLSFVPDDKLGWSPSGSARSALWIVGHCAQANQAFTRGIRGDAMEMPSTAEEFSRMIYQAGRDTKTREEAVERIESSTASLLYALDGLTEARFGESIPMPFGAMPIPFWITLPGLHMSGHARQIDYLQTVWGDLQDHMAA